MSLKAVNFHQFDVKVDIWDAYIDRLNYCFEANGVEEDSAKRANFYTVCGNQVFETLLALITPRKSSEVTFSEIVVILTNHYSPKPNEIATSFKFYKRDQRPGESAADYIAELRKLSYGCNFSNLERMLRDRLVCGMRNQKLQYELLKSDNLQYKDVVDSMISSEAAGNDVRMIQTASVAGPVTSYQAVSSAVSAGEPMDVNAVTTKSSYRLCYRCGERHGGECRFANVVCHYCKKKGHIEKICAAKRKNSANKVNYANEESDDEFFMNGIYTLESNIVRVPAYCVKVLLEGVPVMMEVDSGAAFSIVNLHTWRQLQSEAPLRRLHNRLCTWNSAPVAVIGQTSILVKFRDIECKLDLVIANGKGPNLLGRNWFGALGISLTNINLISDIDMSGVDFVLAKYREVFRAELGTYRGDPVNIQLKPDASPKFLKARSVPFAIKARVEREIDRMVNEGVLQPVSFSEWATPVVPIVKKNGDIRLCGDYRSTVNRATESDTYPMPTASEVFAAVAGGQFYTTLDLDRAYTQVVVSDDTARLLTLNTCKGLFTVHRLAFGVKACPGIFQRLMTALLAGVAGVAVLIDDVIVSGRTLAEMTERLDTVLERIEKAGLRLNESKCKFAKQRVEFLGFIIDRDGIHPAQSKVESIHNTPEPANVQQLQAFLGLYNFYERFIPQKATVLEPLHRLLDKSHDWKWTEAEQNSFDTAKRLLSSELTLVHYDLNRPLVLTCDSSDFGVGAVLSHIMDDGTERPIAMGSRTLHSHERRYSQLDKEATAILFGVKKFHNYLMGRVFKIITDHKPLLGIFDPNRPIPNVLSPRLTRIALVLASLDYQIAYKPGTQIGHADGLSRWPQPVPEQPESQLHDILLMSETPQDFPINSEQIAMASKRDTVLSRVSRYILSGWPPKVTDDQIRPYWLHRTELSLCEDCILLGNRVVVPPALRDTVMRALHKTHNGIVHTKALARSYVWWPELNSDIETMVQSCEHCLENRHMPPKTTYEWITPSKPWSRINVDFAGPFQNNIFLIVVDAYSRWPEVIIVNNMTSATVIRHLRMLFATHGLCETLVSDNGTPFVSSEMKQFLDSNNIRHLTTAPYHPSTNGLAERMVQTVKDKLRKMKDISWDVKLPLMLLGLRTTPCSATNKSPAELLMNRRLRTLLDTIHPDNHSRILREEQVTRNAQVKCRQSDIGQRVMYRNFSSGPRWLPGTIVDREGPSSYSVGTTEGTVVSRHIDQLFRQGHPNSEPQSEQVDPEQEGEGREERVEDGTSQEAMVEQDIIEIPSADKWAEMLGIPVEPEPGFSGGKIKNKSHLHDKTPYVRPNLDYLDYVPMSNDCFDV